MVQRSGDIQQDVIDIIRTRENLTKNLEEIKTRIRGVVGMTTYKVEHALDGIKQTGDRLRHTLNPYRLVRHPIAIVGALIIGYVVKSRFSRSPAHDTRRKLSLRSRVNRGVSGTR